jgi:NAD(P)-dependent dehydrogenase (short-subunit alcohol dehydrogenase family)
MRVVTDNRPAAIGDGAGRVVVVTCASSGIGLATAQQRALAGPSVVLGARRSMVCEEAAAKLQARGATAVAVALDLTDASSIDQFVERVHSLFGPIDRAHSTSASLDHNTWWLSRCRR